MRYAAPAVRLLGYRCAAVRRVVRHAVRGSAGGGAVHALHADRGEPVVELTSSKYEDEVRDFRPPSAAVRGHARGSGSAQSRSRVCPPLPHGTCSRSSLPTSPHPHAPPLTFPLTALRSAPPCATSALSGRLPPDCTPATHTHSNPHHQPCAHAATISSQVVLNMQGPGGGLFLLRERHRAAARLSVLRPEDGPHALESRFQRS